MTRTILITGGTGFIGSHIANTFCNDPNASVLVYDIRANNCHNGNSKFMQGDIFDTDQLTKVMKENEVSSVVHLIGNPSIPSCRENPGSSFRLNVLSVKNVLDAMRLSDVDLIVFSSTASVYGKTDGVKAVEDAYPKPTTVYGFHKLAAESLIKAYGEQCGINSIILRIFNVYGDLDKEQGVVSLFIRKAMAREPLVIKGGKQLRDFVALSDVMQAFISALTSKSCENKIINVASGIGLPISDVADMVKQQFPHTEIEYKPSDGSEYSFYGGVSRMKNLLKINPVDPKEGIPKFIEKCKLNKQNT